MTDSWAWLPRVTGIAGLDVLIYSAGMWMGGRDSDSTSRLDAHVARFDDLGRWRTEVDQHRTDMNRAIEKLIATNDRFSAERALIVRENDADHMEFRKRDEAHDARLSSLESDRVAAARIDQRLSEIERRQAENTAILEQLRDRLPAEIRRPARP